MNFVRVLLLARVQKEDSWLITCIDNIVQVKAFNFVKSVECKEHTKEVDASFSYLTFCSELFIQSAIQLVSNKVSCSTERCSDQQQMHHLLLDQEAVNVHVEVEDVVAVCSWVFELLSILLPELALQ